MLQTVSVGGKVRSWSTQGFEFRCNVYSRRDYARERLKGEIKRYMKKGKRSFQEQLA